MDKKYQTVCLINFLAEESEMGTEIESILSRSESIECQRLYSRDLLLDIGGVEKVSNLYFGHDLIKTDLSFFFIKKRTKENEQLSSLLMQYLHYTGARYINPLFREHQENVGKFAQSVKYNALGYSIPRTLICAKNKISFFKDKIESAMPYPLVMKGNGTGGKAVWLINNFEDITRTADEASDNKLKVVMFQEFIEKSHEEFRVVIFGNEVVAQVRRASEEFYNNYSKGASVSTFDLSESEKQLCLEIAAHSQLDYVAVDYMRAVDGSILILEVQTGPSYTVSKIANPDVGQKIASVLIKKYLNL